MRANGSNSSQELIAERKAQERSRQLAGYDYQTN
jgi:hypothetical protein